MKAIFFCNDTGFPERKPFEAIGNAGGFQVVGFFKVVLVIVTEGDDGVRITDHHFLGEFQDLVAQPREFAPLPVDTVDGDQDFFLGKGGEKEKAGVSQSVEVDHIIMPPQRLQRGEKGGDQGIGGLPVNGEDLF